MEPSAGLMSELFKGGFLPSGDNVALGDMTGLGMVSIVGTVHCLGTSDEPAFDPHNVNWRCDQSQRDQSTLCDACAVHDVLLQHKTRDVH